ncbi:hypothetical protein H0A71_06020 [Alcaligenaceae bacterium]|nr:hypothetical protein [Alcaligenaceae bacterium]
MRRIDWVDKLLHEWAAWRLAGSGGYFGSAYHDYDRVDNNPVAAVVEFSIEQEAAAMRIDGALASLPAELSDTVVAVYTWEGGMGVVTAKLRVTRATVHRRLCNADIRISAWLETQRVIAQNTERCRLV